MRSRGSRVVSVLAFVLTLLSVGAGLADVFAFGLHEHLTTSSEPAGGELVPRDGGHGRRITATCP